jgi:FixJ family two-component response regulator
VSMHSHPTKKQPRESRLLFRVRIEFEGGLSDNEIKGEGHSIDLNVNGCSVESEQRISPGMYLTLRFHLPDRGVPVTVTIARVRWAQDSVFGVEFIQMPHNDQLRLKHLTKETHEGEAMSTPQAPLRPQEGPYTILVVDDDSDMLCLCAKTLAQDGFNVLQALGSTEAMEICSTHVGDIHIALVDVMLDPPAFQLKTEKLHCPRVHGHTLVKGLTAKRKGLRVVMMSAHSLVSLTKNGIDLEGIPFLSKPFSREKMITTIRQQLEGHRLAAAPSGMSHKPSVDP